MTDVTPVTDRTGPERCPHPDGDAGLEERPTAAPAPAPASTPGPAPGPGAVATSAADGDPAWRRLWLAAVVFAVGSAVHVVDHLRRGQGSTSDELLWAGNLALVFQVVIVTLVLTRHRLAPLWAATAGLALAAGFTGAHWLPEWSPLSDPVWEVDSLPALTAVASAVEVAGALAVGLCGLAIVRRDGLASFGTPRPHPA